MRYTESQMNNMKFKELNPSGLELCYGTEIICINHSGTTDLTRGKTYISTGYFSQGRTCEIIDDAGDTHKYSVSRFRKVSDIITQEEMTESKVISEIKEKHRKEYVTWQKELNTKELLIKKQELEIEYYKKVIEVLERENELVRKVKTLETMNQIPKADIKTVKKIHIGGNTDAVK